MASSAAGINIEREILHAQQQLNLKDEIIAELRSNKAALEAVIASKDTSLQSKDTLMEVKDAAIAMKDALITELEETRRALPILPKSAAAEPACRSAEACNGSSWSSSSSSNSSSSECSGREAETQQHKRARVHVTESALDHDDTLDHIFSFVGYKEWLYVGGLCRCWRDSYLRSMCCKDGASEGEHAFQTSHRSSFVTAARFSMALANGLTLPGASKVFAFFDRLPALSQQPIEVLSQARVRGAAWQVGLCEDAAYFGNYELLKWLRLSGCPWDALDVAANAIRGERGELKVILPWVVSNAEALSQEHKNELLREAGGVYNITALELLLQQGAEWPRSFVGEHMVHDKILRACWRYEAVAWALSKGCGWGVWRCQDLAPERLPLHMRGSCSW
jgi:hypothetical protein